MKPNAPQIICSNGVLLSVQASRTHSTTTELENAAADVIIARNKHNEARLVEKNRLAAVRAARADKAGLKARLNLQEGVSLKGIDVGQYEALLSGLEPVRLHAYKARLESLREELARLTDGLNAFGMNFRNYNPRPEFGHGLARGMADKHYRQVSKTLSLFFQLDYQTGIASPFVDLANRLHSRATQYALGYVQGYAAKLAMKTGEVIANDSFFAHASWEAREARVSTNNLWSDSNATVVIQQKDGGHVTSVKFHTQMIWNHSCLGKQFNQFPTRRVE